MIILVDKILSAFAFPLGFVSAGLLVAFLAIWLGARRTGLAAALLLTSTLWVASTPASAWFLLQTLETRHPSLVVEDYKQVDVIIVLGGGIRPSNPANPYSDLGEASDRVLHAYRAFKAGKAHRILLSGGSVFDSDAQTTEAGAMAEVLVSLGIDRDVLILETTSRNTYENAAESLVIWHRENFKSGLLITSAAHMPRALAVFRNAGMAVEPASTDAIHGSIDDPLPLSLLPDSESLGRTTKALKEWLGLLLYRWRGWA